MKIVIVSGFFNPIHSGHIAYLKEARKLGDFLLVILGTDKQVKLKGSIPFMNFWERYEIISAIKYVDEVKVAIDDDSTVNETLRQIKQAGGKDYEFIFAKGGDRNMSNTPEYDTCKELGIDIVFRVGGDKTQSSSELIRNAQKMGKL